MLGLGPPGQAVKRRDVSTGVGQHLAAKTDEADTSRPEATTRAIVAPISQSGVEAVTAVAKTLAVDEPEIGPELVTLVERPTFSCLTVSRVKA